MECLILIVAIALIPVSAILNGVLVSQLWTWFVVPVFELPVLSVGQAVGLSFIIGVFTYQEDNTEYADNSDRAKNHRMITAIVKIFLRPVFYFVIGIVIAKVIGVA